ncbi:MAG: beta-hydroxyacyl-ACP dehydratase [Planctomycetota bacterium]|nr:MAG: beta-hydroxyacyl-ACP dehydratase [Planctomycetota bacterium]
MKFILIDRILSLAPPSRIVTRKNLTLAEEYLADHFPTFPVMPGVMMLEAMVQSAAWLVRATQDFTKSMVVLEEAKNINYKSFVAPGRTLEVVAEAVEITEHGSDFKAFGRSDGEEMVKARLKLRHYNLAEKNRSLADIDEKLIAHARKTFELIGGPAAMTLPAAVTVNS